MSDTPETDVQELVHSVSGAKLHCVDVEFARKLERERNRLRVTLEEIASLDTSQDASPQQCGAVLIAMNVLNK